MDGQLSDAQRRLANADRHIAAGDGSRALEEVYPGVMGAAMVQVWLEDEAWHRQRSLPDTTAMVRERLPSGFAMLFDMKQSQRGLTGWRAQDAQPLVDEARTFVATVTAELERRRSAPA